MSEPTDQPDEGAERAEPGDDAETGTDVPDPIPGEGDPVATGPKGGGEWPDPDSPPTGPAPGVDPERAEAIDEQREQGTGRDPSGGSGSVKDVLEADPVRGGSGSIARD